MKAPKEIQLMSEFFKNLPLNTAKIYTEHEMKSGCLVYLPAGSNEAAELNKLSFRLFVLDEDPQPPIEAS